jgi:hypothetical protein
MAETFGGNRGFTPSISKGIKRTNIRYSINDKNDGTSIRSQDTTSAYRAKTIAKIQSLEYYLGTDWIDWDCTKIEITDKSKTGGKSSVNSTVLRCSDCNKIYQTKTLGLNDKIIGNTFIKHSFFDNVPLYRGKCGLPEECNA